MPGTPTRSDILTVERQYFAEMKPELLKHSEGKFALIKGRELVGTFDTQEAAYEAGIHKFGNVPMLIEPILSNEIVAHFPALQLGLINASS